MDFSAGVRMGRRTIVLMVCALILSVFAVGDNLSPAQIIRRGQVADALAGKSRDHERAGDYTWNNSRVIPIRLNGRTITVEGEGATVDGRKVTITAAGTYSLSGTLNNGQLVVDTADDQPVRLIFNGVDISNSTSAAVYIMNADKVIIILAENTENHITDGEEYIFEAPEVDEPNAAIFSRENLTIHGEGSLTVDGLFNDGIGSKDGLIISSGNITVNAVDDGIRGKDYLIVKNGNLTVNAGGDGLKSDNTTDSTRGYVYIVDGILHITAGGDAIAAETDVLIGGGEIILSAGGGSTSRVYTGPSTKGINAGDVLIIDDGTITINSTDDGLHSNGSLAINGGSITISTSDDGIHATSEVAINGGETSIVRSYEGIESRSVISINDGIIHVTSSDDALNVGAERGAGGRGGYRMPGGGGGFTSGGNYYIYINGGYLVINSGGDGIDANGSIEMTDGTVIVNGPTSSGNGALDHSGFRITGGFLLAAGSSRMAQSPGTSSTQNSVLLTFRSYIQAGTLFCIRDSNGNEILRFTPVKMFQSVAFSSPELKRGSTYEVYVGGSTTGRATDGIYQGGTYTPGTLYGSFTVSSTSMRM